MATNDPKPESGDTTRDDSESNSPRRPHEHQSLEDESTLPVGPGKGGPTSFPSLPNYEILAELGRGGMGVVYKARHRDLNRIVALKMILSGGHASPEDLARFQSEAEAVAALTHPNIIQIFEVGNHDGLPYFTLEYCEYGSLADHVSEVPFDPRTAAELVEKLARSIAFAHTQGVVHRDLKPANVLLAPLESGVYEPGVASTNPILENPKVTDFGLAKNLKEGGSLTQTGAVMGTPSYMAPEQAGGASKHVGPAADVYALGAILYRLLTGRPPFDGETHFDILLHVVGEDPPTPRSLNTVIPRDLEVITLKCLEKGVPRRYSSATELADDLRNWLEDRPIQARPTRLGERVVKWGRRNPARAVASGLGVLSLMVLVIAILAVMVMRARSRSAAEVCLGRGHALCERGDISHGMLWLARGLEVVPITDHELESQLRATIAGWGLQLHPLEGVVDHGTSAWDVAVSPDGTLMATSGPSDTVRLWNVADGRMVEEIPPPREGSARSPAVASVAFSPEGRFVGMGHWSGLVRVWDRDAALIVAQFRHDGPVRSVAFGPRRNQLLSGSEDGTARLWNLDTNTPEKTWHHPEEVWAVAFDPLGESIVTGCQDGVARIWKLNDTTDLNIAINLQHDASVPDVEFNVDGSLVLTCGLDGYARIWDATTGEPIGKPFEHPEELWSVTWGRSIEGHGEIILTGCRDGGARVWSSLTGEQIGAPLWHQDVVWGVAVSPDGSLLMTASEDGSGRIWRRRTGIPLLPQLGSIESLDFSPDGATLATGGSSGLVHIWDVATGRRVGAPLDHGDVVTVVRFHPIADQLLLLTAGRDKRAHLWDLATGTRVASYRHDGEVLVAEFNADGEKLAIGSRAGTSMIWDGLGRSNQPLHGPLPHDGRVTTLAHTADGKHLLTGSGDGKLRLWSITTGELVRTMDHGGWIYGVAVHPTAMIGASGGRVDNGAVRLWDLSTGTMLGEPLPHRGPVYEIGFRPRVGDRILTGSGDWCARLWGIDDHAMIGEPCPHQGAVRATAFRPDGARFVTGSTDGTVRVWDAETGRLSATGLVRRGSVQALAYDPNGDRIAVVTKNGLARIWEPAEEVTARPSKVTLSVEVVTGMSLDDRGYLQILDAQSWRDHRAKLEKVGGSVLP